MYGLLGLVLGILEDGLLQQIVVGHVMLVTVEVLVHLNIVHVLRQELHLMHIMLILASRNVDDEDVIGSVIVDTLRVEVVVCKIVLLDELMVCLIDLNVVQV